MKKMYYGLVVLLLVCLLIVGGVNAWGKSVNVTTLDSTTSFKTSYQETTNPTCPVDNYIGTSGKSCPVTNHPISTGTGTSFCSDEMGCVYPSDYVQNFHSLDAVGISAKTLAGKDTLILFGFNPGKLNATQKAYINTWVNNGGKLIIWDSEDSADVGHFDYTWMTHPFSSSGPGATGSSGYPLWIIEEDQLATYAAGPYHIGNTSIGKNTDAVGDSAIFAPNVAGDWCENMESQNVLNMKGPTHVYSKVGKGLVIYSGLDWDDASSSGWWTGGGAELKKVLRNELNASSLPCAVTWSGNLVVTKKTDKSRYKVGDTITFTVNVTNPANNTETSYNTTLTDHPPAQVTLAKKVWNLGTIAPGSSKKVVFTGTANQNGIALQNTAGVTGNNTHWSPIFSGSAKAIFTIGGSSSGVGVFRPAIHTFLLKNGTANTSVNWGLSTDKPVTGDWNGDGLYDVGVFRPSAHIFYLKNGTTTGTISWGLSTDMPVSGDWNGDGLWDVGVFRNSTHTFYLKNGTANTSVNFGLSTDLPVSGDWNNDGLTDVGVFRPSTHIFYLKNGTTTGTINWGLSTDLPVSGKWG